jgi:hypothetical protein
MTHINYVSCDQCFQQVNKYITFPCNLHEHRVCSSCLKDAVDISKDQSLEQLRKNTTINCPVCDTRHNYYRSFTTSLKLNMFNFLPELGDTAHILKSKIPLTRDCIDPEKTIIYTLNGNFTLLQFHIFQNHNVVSNFFSGRLGIQERKMIARSYLSIEPLLNNKAQNFENTLLDKYNKMTDPTRINKKVEELISQFRTERLDYFNDLCLLQERRGGPSVIIKNHNGKLIHINIPSFDSRVQVIWDCFYSKKLDFYPEKMFYNNQLLISHRKISSYGINSPVLLDCSYELNTDKTLLNIFFVILMYFGILVCLQISLCNCLL